MPTQDPLLQITEAYKRVDDDVNAHLTDMRKTEQSPLDIALLDSVVRPFLKHIEKSRINGTKPADFIASTEWLVALMLSETILNTCDRSDFEAMINNTNVMFGSIAERLNNALAAAAPSPSQAKH